MTVDDTQQTMSEPPGRPLGLTLAILANAFIFSVVPLLRLGFDLLIMNHLNNLHYTIPSGGQEIEPIFSGGNANIVSSSELILISFLGIAFLVVSIFAWRGKPWWIRYVLYWGVLVLDIIYTPLIIGSILKPLDISQGISSADGFLKSSQIGYLASIILVSMYLLWYMNRAPARAFYRGYYLPTPATLKSEVEISDSPVEAKSTP
ncbi:MAG TPA: hypothetical protein VHL11_19115 [Phototrophicaceae bacterium]|nr:hypothetical protein [Phototrophicaceae bacterium]